MADLSGWMGEVVRRLQALETAPRAPWTTEIVATQDRLAETSHVQIFVVDTDYTFDDSVGGWVDWFSMGEIPVPDWATSAVILLSIRFYVSGDTALLTLRARIDSDEGSGSLITDPPGSGPWTDVTFVSTIVSLSPGSGPRDLVIQTSSGDPAGGVAGPPNTFQTPIIAWVTYL